MDAVLVPLKSDASLIPLRSAHGEQQTFDCVMRSVSSIGVQTSNVDPVFRTISTVSRDINHWQQSPLIDRAPSRKPSSKLALDKGCMTEEIVEDVAFKKSLAILRSFFPSMVDHDLADVLDKCQGDATWAVNLLLDSGYQCAGEVAETVEYDHDDGDQGAGAAVTEDETRAADEMLTMMTTAQQANNDEMQPVASSAASASAQQDTEELRKWVENRFVMSDTISDQARRICGKDYHQFRASQISKARHGTPADELKFIPCVAPSNDFIDGLATPDGRSDESPEMAFSPTAYEEDSVKIDDDGSAMIPMTLDETFSSHLIALFGDPRPNLRRAPTAPAAFDIPWSLAEQIYSHWVSSLIDAQSDHGEAGDEEADDQDAIYQTDVEESRLRDIMDFELAMQLVEEEVGIIISVDLSTYPTRYFL